MLDWISTQGFKKGENHWYKIVYKTSKKRLDLSWTLKKRKKSLWLAVSEGSCTITVAGREKVQPKQGVRLI